MAAVILVILAVASWMIVAYQVGYQMGCRDCLRTIDAEVRKLRAKQEERK